MRVLFALAAVGLALPVQAQAPVIDATRFARLEVGNRWDYTTTKTFSGTLSETSYRVATVDREILVGGEPYVVTTVQTFDASRVATSPLYTCAYSPTLGAAPEGSTSLPDYDCARQTALPPVLPFAPTTITPSATIDIGAQTLLVDSLLSYGNQQQGSGGAYSAYTFRYATGIGHVSYRSWGQYHQGAGGGTFEDLTQLSYARLGGVEYGATVVAAEPEASVRLDVVASPNPSAGAVRIEARNSFGKVSVEVFDALGRRVDGGTASASAPFTFRAAAPGVYVVRVQDETGQTVTRRVVRR